jgi:uncharacterized protein (TIGR02246 family)
MEKTMRIHLIGGICCLLFAASSANAQETSSGEIEAAVQSYASAFNARDATKLASHWASEGVYTNRSTGEQVVGRDAIGKQFEAMFAGKDVPKLNLASNSIEFVSPNVALERGMATITEADESVSTTNYKAVLVKHDGKWLLDRVTEENDIQQASNYEHLKELEWIVGTWVDESDGLSIRFQCNWTTNKNYISRKYTVSQDGNVVSSGLQMIGWDAKNKNIRSWLFDSDGGFVSGTWSGKDGRWVVQSVVTLQSGEAGSFTSIFRQLEDGSYSWKKINRSLNGAILANINEAIVRRE